MTDFDKLLDKAIDLDQEYSDHNKFGGYKLGHHNDIVGEIVFYGVKNQPADLADLKQKMATTGVVHYRVIIHQPKDEYTNVAFADIGL